MELLDNLLITQEISKQNVAARRNLDALNNKINNTNIAFIIIGLTVWLSLSIMFVLRPSPYVGIIFLLLINGISVFVALDQKKKVIRKRQEKYSEEIESYMQIRKQTINDLTNISVLPREYWDLDIIELLIKYVKNKRAETLKEAINLYEMEKQVQFQHQQLSSIQSQQKQLQTQMFLTSLSNAIRK